jgi:hypothetical protein
MSRGMLTEKVKRLSLSLLGYEMSQIELRLLPYLQFTLMNDQKLDQNKINQQEREILSRYRAAGLVTGGASLMTVTKEFWNIINEILFVAYVDIGGNLENLGSEEVHAIHDELM